MRKIKEVLRLRALGHTDREIARSLDIGHSTVRRYRERAEAAGLSWPLPADLRESELEARLFPAPLPASQARPVPEWKEIHAELRRAGVTLQLLWVEYKEANPQGYQYSQFCERYRRWKDTLDVVLRQEHRAGHKAFVDYAGDTVEVIDRTSGEIREAQIFVGVLGASNYTYAEATWTQALPDWTASHVRMFEYMQGVPEVLVVDNLRSGVKTACYYDPDINPTYQELANHYSTSVLPTRPRSPRDNAKAEAGVQFVERWILARLRNHTFFSLAELNEQIGRLLDELNDRPFQKLDGSRRSLFESVERAALRPLPAKRYVLAKWRKARANIDYHIDVEGHFYSVPHRLTRKQVEVRLTASTVEAFYDGHRVATHLRSYKKGGFTTDANHRPKSHREYLEWTPSRIVRWARKTGPHAAELVEQILEQRPHPEHGYRACLGILRLGQRYSPERLEAACRRALKIRGVSYRSVKSILKNGLDQVPLQDEHQTTLALPQDHDNLRGSNYFNDFN